MMQRQSRATSQKQTVAQSVSKQQPPWKPKTPRHLPLPPIFVVEHDVTWHGISLWSVGSAVPAVSPRSFLSTLSLLAAGRGEWGKDKA